MQTVSMNEVTTANPMMQLIILQSQEYYTSFYFQQWYLHNSASTDGKVKFKRHDSFVRRIKNVESFPLYVERGDIILLTRQMLTTKNVDSNTFKQLQQLLALNNYHPVYLINAAFQLELAHHLDDPVSKAVAYSHSQQGATPTDAISDGNAIDKLCAHLDRCTEALTSQHLQLSTRVDNGFSAHDQRLSVVENEQDAMKWKQDALDVRLEGTVTRAEAEQMVKDAVEAAMKDQNRPPTISPHKLTFYDYLKDTKQLAFSPTFWQDYQGFYDIASLIEPPELYYIPGRKFPYRYYSRATLGLAWQRYLREHRGHTPGSNGPPSAA